MIAMKHRARSYQGNAYHLAFTMMLVTAAFRVPLFAAPSAFHLTAPDSVWITSHSPVFSWEASSGTSQYELWIDGVRSMAALQKTSVSVTPPMTSGYHTWFVKASDGATAVASADTFVFHIGPSPQHGWEFVDGFERGDLNDYIANGIGIGGNALSGSYCAVHQSAASQTMDYAYNPAFTNTQEAEASVLFSLDDAAAKAGVGFAAENGVWCYAFVNRTSGNLTIERRAPYSIFPHTEAGYARSNWTERQENGFYLWCADTVKLPSLTQGTHYRLRFQMSNRLPSMGKPAQAILESENGSVLCSIRTFLDDVFTPHPMFIMRDGMVRVDDFSYIQLDRWSYNWKAYPKPLNPSWSGFNPAVWRDSAGTWWLTARTDNKIRWSVDGISWSTQTAAAPPVSIMDPATLGVHANPWNDGRTYLASCDGCCFNPVQIFSSANPASGVWTTWAEHPGLTLSPAGQKGGCGREHVFLDTKDWSTLAPIVYNGTPYRFLNIEEGDVGKGGSTMMKLTNDQKTFTEVECNDLYTNATNYPLLQKNLWMMECLNSATSCAMALDGDIRVMTFKDGMRYEKAMPLEAVLDGRQPWKVKALQTIPGFPYYWGDWHITRDKNGASWYGGKYQWPSCFVWVPEERRAYCYWGEEDAICLSTALVVPEMSCAALSIDSQAVAVGAPLTLRALVWNAGDAAGADTVNLVADGTVIESKTITLAANTDTVLAFTVTPQTAGTHQVSIDNCVTAFTATGTSGIGRPPVVAPVVSGSMYTISIFDLRGKLVGAAVSGVADPQRMLVDKRMPAGIYFVRICRGDEVHQQKILFGQTIRTR
jgi:hypothetical protein